MGRNIPLGRFAGIRISMSWLVPVIGLFYAVSLAEGSFPREVPGLGRSTYWAVGVFGAVLFFISLLAHEVGHALVARREGVGVEGISLWLMGGLAKLEHEARSAGAELRIAVIGPLTSAAVGVVFYFLGKALSGSVGVLELFSYLFGWLAFINVLLAAFNLLPGAPLDGGRVMSALVWMRTRDQTKAQAVGARVGQGLGALLLAGGAYMMFSLDNSAGLWVLIVGMYIFGNATSELKSTAGLGMLRSVTLREVMQPDPPVLPDWMTVQDLVVNAPAYMPHTAFVTQSFDGRVSGLITAEAVQAADPSSWPSLRLSDLAFPVDRLVTAAVDDSVLVTMQRSRDDGAGRVLVLHPDGRIAGVTGADIGRRAAAAHQVRQMRPAPTLPGFGTGANGTVLQPSSAPTSTGAANASGPPTGWPRTGA